MNGEVRYIAHISQDNPTQFYRSLKSKIEEVPSNLYAEVQYHTTIQPNGKALFSAIILGRETEAK